MSEDKKRGPYTKKGSRDYINGKELTQKLIDYSRYFNEEKARLAAMPENAKLKAKELKELTLANTKMPDSLSRDILTLSRRICSKFNFSQYTYRDEMELDAIYTMYKGASNFDESYEPQNGFAYLSQVAHSGIINRIKAEQKHAEGKDQLVLNLGAEYLEDENVGESLKKLQESASERLDKKSKNVGTKATFKIRNRKKKAELVIDESVVEDFDWTKDGEVILAPIVIEMLEEEGMEEDFKDDPDNLE